MKTQWIVVRQRIREGVCTHDAGHNVQCLCHYDLFWTGRAWDIVIPNAKKYPSRKVAERNAFAVLLDRPEHTGEIAVKEIVKVRGTL